MLARFAAVLMVSLAAGSVGLASAPAARFADTEHAEKASAMIAKAEQFLLSREDAKSGGWSLPESNQPHIPAISALVVRGLLMNPGADPVNDPPLARAVDYMLARRQADGGIYDKLLPVYNTSLCLSALAKVNSPRAREAIKPAQDFLRRLQWSEHTDPGIAGGEAARPVQKDHVFYGGVGYGRSGRPDNSNLNMFMQAMEDSGVSPQDESVQRALTFLRRTQMDDRINDLPFAKGSRQGGFIYSTSPNAESVDGKAGQSFAGTFEETLSDGTKASRLRAYGTMTYAGFKSYLYAELPRTDVRVTSAYDWIRRNYSVKENPGLGPDGMYYYFVVFARGLSVWGEPAIQLLDENSSPTGQERRWADDLIDRLAELQNPDGSFRSVKDRWMESNPDLTTAYSLIALRYAAQ